VSPNQLFSVGKQAETLPRCVREYDYIRGQRTRLHRIARPMLIGISLAGIFIDRAASHPAFSAGHSHLVEQMVVARSFIAPPT
jgi:hypothetical protein